METKMKTNPAAAFESRNFRLATAGWMPMESPSGFRYLAHPFGLALEISQGPMKGEQHFSNVWQFLGSPAIHGCALPETGKFLEAAASEWAGKNLPKSGSANYSCRGYAMVGSRGYYWTLSASGEPECVILGEHGGPKRFVPRNGIGGFSVRLVRTPSR